MTNFTRLTLTAASLAFALTSAAEAEDAAEWKFSGSFRTRYEVLDDQVRPNFNSNENLISIRTTLAVERRQGPLTLAAEMYDSRVTSANRRSPISTNEVNTAELVQAYAALKLDGEALGPVTLQAGRFMLNIGSRRLVAADDYRNTTNGYTGLRIDMAPAGVKTTLIYVMPQVRRPGDIDSLLDNRQYPDTENDDLVVWGGLVARPRTIGKAALEAEFFHFEEHDAPGAPTRDRDLDTFGLRVILDPAVAAWDYEIEAIGQTGAVSRGSAVNDPTLDVRAGFVHADVGYTRAGGWKPRLSAEFDYASGDKPGGRYGRFDTLLGMRRADFGPSGIYAAIGRANIITPGVRLEVTPSKRLDAFASYRAMWLASDTDSFSTTSVRDAAGGSGDFAGHQLEGRVRYWAIKDRLRLEANGLLLAKGRFLQDAPNAPQNGDTSAYLAISAITQF
ncbi:alginate export family protein [Caulobacter sp. NIBR2454]|uniref:alginate export family protein n=1 Tax=Caulobacter sp. NIBR2454 TaxID=3015996 RepID=UPI0022B74117|nr:alginate export family protein [Caulobacter sp. NIBR2454]